jgi:ubiquinone/menaquinone biosynthesis C-methylase UbiE
MNVKEAYNSWAEQYDTNLNKTRDLEAVCLRNTLSSIAFKRCLEIGCGTGKNTEWLVTKATELTAVDFSAEMLAKAKEKITSANVTFHQADITHDWDFVTQSYDLATFSLVLEHIEDLNAIFQKLAPVITQNGYVYIGELHPFKQYAGSKARFDTKDGQQVVTCYTHNLSDFTQAAKANGFAIADVNEYFDDDDRTNIPRILALLFKKI